ncbi:MAG: hypothetical protein MUO26_00190 [Methanotrichaceae archaeon]|nr:hypothetical protein [Methanotrichaceae archaeon]
MKRKLDLFPLEISFFNAIAYLSLTIGATYVDSHYYNIYYGIRFYPLGYSVGIFSIFIFLLTFIFNLKNKCWIFEPKFSSRLRSIGTFFVLFIPILILLCINFGPEYPHYSILLGSLAYAIILSLLSFIHNYEINFDFVIDGSIEKLAIIEK